MLMITIAQDTNLSVLISVNINLATGIATVDFKEPDEKLSV